GSQRLVGRQHDGRPPGAGDQVGHGVGLARARHPQQGLAHEPVSHTLFQRVDRGRLVAGRRIGLEKLERTVRVLHEARPGLGDGRGGDRRIGLGPGPLGFGLMWHGAQLDTVRVNLLLSHCWPTCPRLLSLALPVTMSSIFASVDLAPRDPILGLNEQFKADTRPTKVNLGVGVYYDDAGRIPLLKAVRQAEARLFEQAEPRNYLPIDGIPGYNNGARALLLGAGSSLIAEHRSLTVQTLGGTGALKVGADFLRQILPDAKVAISNPSWANHQAL